MLKNYLKIAMRNLGKYKFISFINLFGLSTGLACCLIILTYVLHETSYDKFNSKADRIYRVTRSFNNKEGIESLHLSSVAPPFGPLLMNDFPDIRKMTRMLPVGPMPVRYENNIFNEQNVSFADSNFFNIFDIPIIEGDRNHPLSEPFCAMMTPAAAKKYFGNADPINKFIRMDDQYNIKVTGIFSPLPSNSHFHVDVLLSFSTLNDSAIYGEKGLATNWGNNAFYTYLLFPEHYPVQQVEAQFPAFLDRHMATSTGYGTGSTPHQLTKIFLQPLTDIHLYSHLDDEMEPNGDIRRVYIFSAIALFILLIACINYMNLSTARSTLRAKEIGIRKVSGARRQELIAQFLCESILIAYMAILLAGGLTILTMPWVDSMTGLDLSPQTILQTHIIIPLLLAPLVVGTISGLYPAVFLSSFQPVKVLKGLFKAGNSTVSFRKVLVITQFAISIVLLISTAIIFQQLHFMENTSLGFDKEHVVTMGYNSGLDKTYESFRNALLQNPRVLQATRSSRIPSGRLLDSQGASSESGDSLRPVTATIKYVAVDPDFMKTYGIPIVAGRDFSRDYSTDSSNFLLNSAAARALGVRSPGEMVGKNFSYGGVKGKVIGITGDFNFEDMHQKIVPVVFIMGKGFGNISIKLAGGDIQSSLDHIEKTWKRYLPRVPFEYTFLNERFDQLYRSEQRQGSLFTAFSAIAIFIACLGLFGLSAFTVSQRVKEIGIRKVLGASAGSIVGLLSKEFLILVGISAVFAFIIAGIMMNNWLNNFAYRISIQWWIFLAAGLLAAGVALVTISVQAIRAALANPVKSLRSE